MRNRSSSHPVDVVVIGHAGWSTILTPEGEHTAPGGSGYAVAASAAAIIGSRVGLVAQVGPELDVGVLHDLGVNLDGVATLPGTSAKLHIDQHYDGTRAFRSDLGVAGEVRTSSFPAAYLSTRYIHLGTAPPDQQLTWLRFLHERHCRAKISVDMFEHFVQTDPDRSREVCDTADLAFMNEVEYEGLYQFGSLPKPPVIRKQGPAGAQLLMDGRTRQDVAAPSAQVLDPTGGGEILAGVFLALRVLGLESKYALRYAVRAATACVEEFGVHGPQLAASLADIRRDVSASGA
ncbi:MAG TPA: carbohydrate kinase family protein [Streptosporangiaceae bacterium]|jgi:sugar/nucleoside kinase (ribokinase family)